MSSVSPAITEEGASDRATVLPFAIKEKGLLYATYMSMIENGAIFVPTNKDLRLGDEVFVLLSVPDKQSPDERYPIHGKVVWWTPPRAQHKRVQGVGVQFPPGQASEQLCARIEQILGAHLGSERETLTL